MSATTSGLILRSPQASEERVVGGGWGQWKGVRDGEVDVGGVGDRVG